MKENPDHPRPKLRVKVTVQEGNAKTKDYIFTGALGVHVTERRVLQVDGYIGEEEAPVGMFNNWMAVIVEPEED